MTQLDEFIGASLRDRASEADVLVRAAELGAVLAEGSRRAKRRRIQRRAAAAAGIVAVLVLVFVAPLPYVSLHHGPASTEPLPTNTGSHPGTTTVAFPGGSSGPSVADLLSGRWSTMPAAPIVARGSAVVVWTGRELIVWGGSTGANGSQLLGDGAAYAPSTNEWRLLPPAPLSPRTGASAVWTGTEMIVFGGYDNLSPGAFHVTNDAAAYTPSTNSWKLLPPGPLAPRAGAIGIWTGSRAVFLGGTPAVSTAALGSYGDGAVFDPSTETWQHVPAPVPPAGHALSWRTAVLTGHELIGFSLWSESRSLGGGTYTESGGADLFTYDLRTGRWRSVPTVQDALPGPEEAISAGALVIVRGSPYNCGACQGPFVPEVTELYDPAHNSWTRIAPDPLATDNLVSAWTGRALFSFDASSEAGSIRPGDASLYDPSTGRWNLLPPAPSSGCSAEGPPIWTGRQVLVACPIFGRGAADSVAGLVYTPGSTP